MDGNLLTSTPAQWQLPHGVLSTTSQRTLRARQVEQAFTARRLFPRARSRDFLLDFERSPESSPCLDWRPESCTRIFASSRWRCPEASVHDEEDGDELSLDSMACPDEDNLQI